MQFLITNGGAHPSDKWSEVTTTSILDLIQVADDSTTPEATAARAAKRDLRTKLFDIFNAHHGDVQESERKACLKDAGRIDAVLDGAPHMDGTMEQVKAAFDTTPFAAHFAQDHVQNVLAAILHQHTIDVMHIERRILADQKGA
jgi:hypothetical protein